MNEVIDLMGLLDLAAAQDRRRSTRTPTRLAALVKHDEVAIHRSLSCADYDTCLAEVLIAGWPSWTCRCCPRFELRGEMRAVEIAREGARRTEHTSWP